MAYRTEITPLPGTGEAHSICIPAARLNWPVAGWTLFEFLQKPESAATRRDSAESTILGLGYSIHNCHAVHGNGAPCDGADTVLLRIDSWHYDLMGQVTDLPVMEIVFDARRFSVPARSVVSLKIMARPIKITEKISSRAVNAALFFLHQIQADQVPDFERILELHRLHPDLRRTSDDVLNDSESGSGGKQNNKKLTVPSRRPTLGPKLATAYDRPNRTQMLDRRLSERTLAGGCVMDTGQPASEDRMPEKITSIHRDKRFLGE